MHTVLAALIFCAAAQIEVTVSPDKNLPLAYTGEPLILELRSVKDIAVEGYVTLSGPSQYAIPIEPMTLWGGEARWIVLKDQAYLNGVYDGAIVLNGAECWKGQVVRAAAPNPAPGGPVTLALPITGPPVPKALRHLPLSAVSIPWTRSRGAETMEALQDAGYTVSIEGADADAVAEALGGSEAGLDGEWFVSGSVLTEIGARLNRPIPALGLSVHHPEELKRALLTAETFRPQAIAFTRQVDPTLSIGGVIDEAAQLGHEGIPITASIAGGVPLANAIVVALAEGARRVAVPIESLLDGDRPNQNFVLVSEVNRRLAGARYAGQLDLGEGARGYAFHNLAENMWTLWLWARDNRPVDIPVGDASAIALRDALNNPRTLGDYSTGRLALALGEDLLVLSGSGGDILKSVGHARSQRLAVELAAYAEPLGAPAAPLHDVATALAVTADPTASRFAFFGLIRTLPELESHWLHETAPREVIGPAIMRVARLGSALAVTEQESGAPFLEPLHEALARSREFNAEFLAAERPPSPRSAWLSHEVARLVSRAELLRDRGRPIEAGAIAALAEWRARALLQHLNDAPPEPAPPATPPEEESDE